MRVDELRLAGVGPFAEEQHFAFDAGLNVVLGPNGSGKSTLAWALSAIFLGKQHREADYVRDGGPSWVRITFADGGRTYRLRRDFASGEVELVENQEGEELPLYTGNPLEDGEPAYWQALETALGPGRLQAWLRTALHTQGEPVVEEQADGASLTRVFSFRAAAEERPEEQVLASMRAELEALHGDQGGVAQAEAELARRQEAMRDWASRSHEIQEDALRLRELEQQLEDAVRAADTRLEVMETLRRFQEITQSRQDLEQKLEKVREERDVIRGCVEAVEKAEAELEEEYGDFMSAGPELEEALQGWTDATSRFHEIQRRIHIARQEVLAAPRTQTVRNGSVSAVLLGVLGFFACYGAGAAGFGFILGPLLAIMGYGAIWAKDRTVQGLLRAKREEITALEQETAEVDRVIQNAKSQMGKLGKLGHPMAIRRAVIQYWKAREEVERLRGERDRHASLSEVVNQYEGTVVGLRDLDAESRELVGQAKYLAGLDGSPESLAGEVDMARSQHDASRGRAERLEAECESLRERVDVAEGEIPSLGRLERECREREEQVYELRLRGRALAVAVDALDAVCGKYRRGYHDRVAQRAGKLFGDLTEGRYTRVKYGNPGETRVGNGDDLMVPEQRLSRGLRERLEFALRVAKAREWAGARNFSIVLDDTFVAWDDSGRELARQMVGGLAEQGGQVILLTQDTRFADWSEEVIRLGGPVRAHSAARRAA